jgi:hypothetical protein
VYSPPPFLSDAVAAPPSYNEASGVPQAQRYGPAYAAVAQPPVVVGPVAGIPTTQPIYAQPQYTSAPQMVAYNGGVQTSPITTAGYAQPQYISATPAVVGVASPVAAVGVGIAPAKVQPVVYVPVPVGSPLLAAGVMVTLYIHMRIHSHFYNHHHVVVSAII